MTLITLHHEGMDYRVVVDETGSLTLIHDTVHHVVEPAEPITETTESGDDINPVITLTPIESEVTAVPDEPTSGENQLKEDDTPLVGSTDIPEGEIEAEVISAFSLRLGHTTVSALKANVAVKEDVLLDIGADVFGTKGCDPSVVEQQLKGLPESGTSLGAFMAFAHDVDFSKLAASYQRNDVKRGLISLYYIKKIKNGLTVEEETTNG